MQAKASRTFSRKSENELAAQSHRGQVSAASRFFQHADLLRDYPEIEEMKSSGVLRLERYLKVHLAEILEELGSNHAADSDAGSARRANGVLQRALGRSTLNRVPLDSKRDGVFRIRVSDRHIEKIFGVPKFKITGTWGGGGVAPDGSVMRLLPNSPGWAMNSRNEANIVCCWCPPFSRLTKITVSSIPRIPTTRG